MSKKAAARKYTFKAHKSRPVSAGSSWTRDQLSALIDELKHRPELYGSARASSSDTKRSLMELTKALKPVRSNAIAEDVKSHIRGLRDQYYRELARLEKNKKMGIEDDTPRLWCYTQLSFLNETVGNPLDSDADADDGIQSNRSTSPISDNKDNENEREEEENEDEILNDKWAKDLLQRYLETKEHKTSEHRAFLKFVKSQLKQITNFDILSRTKLGMIQELESGIRQQKQSEQNAIINRNNLNRKCDDADDEMEEEGI